MKISERVSNALASFEATTSAPAELVRLQEFLQEMRTAGVAKTMEYNLPPPDTLGRSMVERDKSR